MIELLIVIAVLGILAVAVLSALNPIEQINRSNDTGNRSDAEQLIGAIDRYYTANGYYPWMSGAGDTSNNVSGFNIINGSTAAWTPVNRLLTVLSNGSVGEVKASFMDRIMKNSYNSLWIHNRASVGDSTYVCFEPKSASFKNIAQVRCAGGMPSDIEAAANNTICNSGGTGNWYSCLP